MSMMHCLTYGFYEKCKKSVNSAVKCVNSAVLKLLLMGAGRPCILSKASQMRNSVHSAPTSHSSHLELLELFQSASQRIARGWSTKNFRFTKRGRQF